MNYHAHIYWKNEDEKTLALDLRLTLHDNGCGLGRIRKAPVGPHPLPMYQVMYNEKNQQFVENYLKKNSGVLSILLHEALEEDHLRDHTQGARWIGPPLELRLEFFDNHPS